MALQVCQNSGKGQMQFMEDLILWVIVGVGVMAVFAMLGTLLWTLVSSLVDTERQIDRRSFWCLTGIVTIAILVLVFGEHGVDMLNTVVGAVIVAFILVTIVGSLMSKRP
jgi:uncharacterized membrane protein YidH (DUF202 family)